MSNIFNKVEALANAENNFGLKNVDDFIIPKCGLYEIDQALFNLFDKDLNLVYNSKNSVKKVPIMFGAGERFSTLNKKMSVRDKNSGSLVLPIISILRKNVEFNVSDIKATNEINSHIIKRRLTPDNQEYQKIVNKLNLKNSDSLTNDSAFLNNNSIKTDVQPGRIATRTQKDNNIYNDFLETKISKDIYEIIILPAPKYVIVNYSVTVWTDYVKNMNEILNNILQKQLFDVPSFKISTDNGYWFTAYLDGDFVSNDNFDDYSDDTRLIKTDFNIKVHAYIIGNNTPGSSNTLKKYYSLPNFAFEANIGGIFDEKKENNEFIKDIEVEDLVKNDTSIGTSTTDKNIKIIKTEIDPMTNEKVDKTFFIKTKKNRQGETVIKEYF